MQITLNIPDNTPVERLQQVVSELSNQLHLPIDLISTQTMSQDTLQVNNDPYLQNKLAQWRQLFKKTQSLPQVQAITDADIDDEIEAYRQGL